MNSEISIKLISNIVEFKKLKPQWHKLLSTNFEQSSFLSWEWLYSWWKINHTEKILWVVTAWRGDKLAGIAPLMIEKRNKILRVLTNLGTPQSDVGGFIHLPNDQDVVAHLLDYVISHKSKWHIVEFNEFNKEWLDKYNFTKIFLTKKLLSLNETNKHYYIHLEDNWEIVSEKLTRKFRYNLRRALRLANEIGPLKLDHFRGNRVTWDILETIIDINRHANHPKLYNSQSEQALLKELAEIMVSSQNLFDVYILSVDNKPCAYEYGFSNGGRFEDWRSGFDTHLPQQISIGKLLAMKVVQECVSQNYTEIDFLRGDEAYKLEWHPSLREYARVRVFNNNILGITSYIWLQKLKPAIKRKSTKNIAYNN